jgi:hypothetical protein
LEPLDLSVSISRTETLLGCESLPPEEDALVEIDKRSIEVPLNPIESLGVY